MTTPTPDASLPQTPRTDALPDISTEGRRLEAAATKGTEPCYIELGARIVRLRKAEGVSQKEVAYDLRMSRSSIANIEAGRQRIALHLLPMLATSIRCNIHDLLDGVIYTLPKTFKHEGWPVVAAEGSHDPEAQSGSIPPPRANSTAGRANRAPI